MTFNVLYVGELFGRSRTLDKVGMCATQVQALRLNS